MQFRRGRATVIGSFLTVESQTSAGTPFIAGRESPAGSTTMTTASSVLDDPYISVGDAPVIPLADLAPWALLALVIATILLYFVSTEQGAFAIFDGKLVHEYVHDGRHLLGFPCH